MPDDRAYELTLVTGPVVEPVTAALAKKQCKVDYADEDSLFAIWIPAARKLIEESCSVRLVDQTWRLVLPDWPCAGEIALPVEPVSAVGSVKYFAADGTLTTLAADTDYWTWLGRKPPIVYPAANASWPLTQSNRRNAVQVEFTAGYGPTADTVPETAKAAVLMTIKYWSDKSKEEDSPEEAPDKLGLPPAVARLMRHLDSGGYR